MALKKGEKAAQKRFQPEIPKEGGKSVVAPLESRNEWSAGKKKKEEKGEKESPMARRSADDFCLMVPPTSLTGLCISEACPVDGGWRRRNMRP